MADSKLNDKQIRWAFHRKRLHKHHVSPDTIVVDELGLQHGRFRADIAVVNGHLIGFEIKSDFDRLHRLHSQVAGYNSVFDKVFLILTDRHNKEAIRTIPNWWGIISAHMGPRGAVYFRTLRKGRRNPLVDNLSVARLLWRDEARDILRELGADEADLRGNRQSLYMQLEGRLCPRDLREQVRKKMRVRSGWRCPSQLGQDAGLCQPNAT